MTSSSYRIDSDVISIGGNRSTSSSYTVSDTIGELSTGEDLASASFTGCSGYQCLTGAPYIAFSVKEGTSSPGTTGAGVDLGALSLTGVKSSGDSGVNTIFITAETNASWGSVVSVWGANAALQSVSVPADAIPSATASLSAGTAGFGICVSAVSSGAESPSSLASLSPYNGTCDTGSGDDVGQISTSLSPILSSSAEIANGAAEVLVKAAISTATPAHSDYAEVLTFTYTATY